MDAFVYEGVRTGRGVGKARGALASVPAIELLAACFRALGERLPKARTEASDVLLGCVTQTGEQGCNIAKISSLYAGFSETISGATINRFCASGLAALGDASTRVASGSEAVVVAGGVESMSRTPMLQDGGAWFQDTAVARRTGFVHMGVAADAVATLANLSREDLDRYALQSHERALSAQAEGRFSRRIVAVFGGRGEGGDQGDRHGGAPLLAQDEGPRAGLTMDKLLSFPPAFAEREAALFDRVVTARHPSLGAVRHLHTVATSPLVADAAALIVVGTAAAAKRLERGPLARIRAVANVGTDPVLMLTGNVTAVQVAVQKAGLTLADIDLFEINESFAAVPLHFAQTLGIEATRLNVSGGAIALGHPLGATGPILLLTLLDDLTRTGGRFGVVSICAGAGIAVALVIERLASEHEESGLDRGDFTEPGAESPPLI
jgi:acetyl-CoA C-acetyltransferase